MEFVIFVIVVAVIAFFVRNKDKKSSPAVSADRNGDNQVSKAELKKLTKVQLVEMAEKKNLKVKKSGSKADVINEIHSQLK